MKVLFITNIPSPYRIDFYNELSRFVDLTVIFEARRVQGIRFNWNDDNLRFKAVFLSEGEIQEKKIDFKIFRYIRLKEYDYIFATNYSYYTELIALLYMQLRKIPYCLEVDGALMRSESKLKFMLKKQLISKASYYFSPSKESDRFLIHYGADKERINRYEFSSLWKREILAEIIDDVEKSKIKRILGLQNKILILCVSQIIHRKGIDILLDALNGLDNDYQCVLVGEKPDEQYYKFVEDNMNNNIIHLEFKDRDTLRKLYQAADVFVLPTRFDVWGLVINEAMANGVPVITTTGCVAGTELVQDGYNGYLVPTEEPYSLREKISILIENRKKRKQMGRNAIKTIQNYTIEQMVDSHKRFLNVL